MEQNASRWIRLLEYFALLVTGGGTGWLVGLSVSPVISIIITSVIGSAAAIVAAMSGIDSQLKDIVDRSLLKPIALINPWPIALLVIGLLIGSYYGVMARTHQWLEPDMMTQIKKWEDAGLNKEKALEVFFLTRHQISISNQQTEPFANTPSSSPFGEGVLFGVSIDECASLLGKSESDLIAELEASPNDNLQSLSAVPDADLLKEIVEKVLCPES